MIDENAHLFRLKLLDPLESFRKLFRLFQQLFRVLPDPVRLVIQSLAVRFDLVRLSATSWFVP
jgi:hypothetical protein